MGVFLIAFHAHAIHRISKVGLSRRRGKTDTAMMYFQFTTPSVEDLMNGYIAVLGTQSAGLRQAYDQLATHTKDEVDQASMRMCVKKKSLCCKRY
jgi:hypothetical protein